MAPLKIEQRPLSIKHIVINMISTKWGTRPFKVIFADGSFTVVDAKSKYEATQLAKPMSKLTTVDAVPLTNWEAEVLERRLYRKNVAITPEMLKAQSGEGANLLTQLSKLDRNSTPARKIRRKLRRLGIKLSESVAPQKEKRRKAEYIRDKVREKYHKKSIETPLMTKRERKKIAKGGIRTDQVLDTAEVLVKKVGYKSKEKLIERLLEIYPKLTKERANEIASKFSLSKNPKVKKFDLILKLANLKADKLGIPRSDRIARGQIATGIEHIHLGIRELKVRIEDLKRELLKKNPSQGPVEIYNKIISIEAQKGQKSNFPKKLFRHDFSKDKTAAKIYGLPDGSLLVKSTKGKKLWKKFDY